jgi:hypothetical protein
MKIESLEQIQRLVQMLYDNKLDLLEVDNIKIVKTKHDFPQPKSKPFSDEDLLFEHEKWNGS